MSSHMSPQNHFTSHYSVPKTDSNLWHCLTFHSFPKWTSASFENDQLETMLVSEVTIRAFTSWVVTLPLRNQVRVLMSVNTSLKHPIHPDWSNRNFAYNCTKTKLARFSRCCWFCCFSIFMISVWHFDVPVWGSHCLCTDAWFSCLTQVHWMKEISQTLWIMLVLC